MAAAAWFAASERFTMTQRVVAASFGLITCSAILVHLWTGYIEAHFHFFVMVGVLTLYQAWVPFLVAIGYVVLHHGIVGVLAPASVYNHPGAIAQPVEVGAHPRRRSCWRRAWRTSSRGGRTRTSSCAIRSRACRAGCCS